MFRLNKGQPGPSGPPLPRSDCVCSIRDTEELFRSVQVQLILDQVSLSSVLGRSAVSSSLDPEITPSALFLLWGHIKLSLGGFTGPFTDHVYVHRIIRFSLLFQKRPYSY